MFSIKILLLIMMLYQTTTLYTSMSSYVFNGDEGDPAARSSPSSAASSSPFSTWSSFPRMVVVVVVASRTHDDDADSSSTTTTTTTTTEMLVTTSMAATQHYQESQQQLQQLSSSSSLSSSSMRLPKDAVGLTTVTTTSRSVPSFYDLCVRCDDGEDDTASMDHKGNSTADLNGKLNAHNTKMDLLPSDMGEDCDYLDDWQRQVIPHYTCNLVHEQLGLQGEGGSGAPSTTTTLSLVGKGGSKYIWGMDNDKYGRQERVLLRTDHLTNRNELMPHNEFGGDLKDVLIMEQTSSSEHIVSLYGVCTSASLVERADGLLTEWLHQHLWKPTTKNHPDMDHNERPIYLSVLQKSNLLLKVATQLTQAVVEMQLLSLPHKNNITHDDAEQSLLPRVVHGDLHAEQFLYKATDDSSNVTFKLNDFNWSRLMKATTATNTSTTNATHPHLCPLHQQYWFYYEDSWRSPEERSFALDVITDKIDAAALGSIFYYLLLGYYPHMVVFKTNNTTASEAVKVTKHMEFFWEVFETKAALTYPSKVTASADPNIQFMKRIIDDCRQWNPTDRPSALQVLHSLQSQQQQQQQRLLQEQGNNNTQLRNLRIQASG